MTGAPRLNFGLYANNRASVFLPDFSLERLLDLAVEAEELGCHSLWAGDSLLAKPRYDQPGNRYPSNSVRSFHASEVTD